MNKEMTLLRQRCKEIISFYESQNNQSKLKIYNAINGMLEAENCFDEIDAEMAFNILSDLGLDEKTANEVYARLISK